MTRFNSLQRQQQIQPCALFQGVVLGVSLLLLAGCDGNDAAPDQTSASEQSPAATGTTQGLTCDTPNYFAEVTSEQGQFSLTFGEKPAANTLIKANPISVTSNPDGSRTYGYQEADATTYARFYPNGTCFVQVVGTDGTVILEEAGQTVQASAAPPTPESSLGAGQLAQYQDGYDAGYDAGYGVGENFRRRNQDNDPDAALAAATLSGDEQYDTGYREGFYSGFDAGYNTFITTAPADPNQDGLAMNCLGTIPADVDFTAYYSREAGFSRIDFSPRQGNQTLTSMLTYDGKDPEGHGIWRGNVAQMADVVLVHLSAQAAQQGDQVSVGYDNRWGRGNCR